MFHIELLQGPNRLHRFNLGEQELRGGVLEPWVRGEPIEMGERTWSAAAGKLLVLEGPEIPIGQLTMGRGWSVAQREGTDVTAQAIAGVRDALIATTGAAAEDAIAAGAASSSSPPAVPTVNADVLADALGLELLRALGETPMSLPAAWRAAAQRHPQLPPGAALDLARQAIGSLVQARLACLSPAGGEGRDDLQGGDLDSALAAIESWTQESGSTALWVRRA